MKKLFHLAYLLVKYIELYTNEYFQLHEFEDHIKLHEENMVNLLKQNF